MKRRRGLPVVGIAGWGALTDRGKVRALNEDALLAEPPLFVVADGMGGHAAGDVASWTAIDAMVDLVDRGPLTADDVLAAIQEANGAILRTAQCDPERAGMGTTITGLAAVNEGGVSHWMVFNVGDSRVYRLVDGQLVQLTVDHSEAEEMVLAGRISREEARLYGRRHVVTRSLGTDPPPVADSWVFPPVVGERFLVCSDGLSSELRDPEIQACLEAEADPQSAVRRLLDAALRAGGRDNITAIVIDGDRSDTGDIDADTTPREPHGV